MKIALLVVAMLLAGCASQRPLPQTENSSRDAYDRDMSECEREAALSSAGSKAQAFANCMKARKQTPVR